MAERSRHPIIVLWAHPRSMSTATERIMRERGDCQCMHEPFMYYYYVHLARKTMPHFEAEEDRPSDFDAIVEQMFEAARHTPVFSKDMAYYVLPEIYRHPDLAHELEHVFLIRDPRRAILSYHRLDPNIQLVEVGLESQWELYKWLESHNVIAPLVIRAEDIQNDPQGIIGAMWQRTGLEYKADAFEWKRDDAPEDWKQVSLWHRSTQDRRSIERETTSETALQREFDLAAKSAPGLQTLLHHHLPFYQMLAAAALRSPAI